MTNTMIRSTASITEGHLRDIRATIPNGGTRRGIMTACLNYFEEGDPTCNIEQAILAFNALVGRG